MKTSNQRAVEKIQKWMEINDKKRGDIANELEISPSLIGHYLNGQRTIPSKRLDQFANLLNISIQELLADEENSNGYTLQLRGSVNSLRGERELQNLIFAITNCETLYSSKGE